MGVTCCLNVTSTVSLQSSTKVPDSVSPSASGEGLSGRQSSKIVSVNYQRQQLPISTGFNQNANCSRGVNMAKCIKVYDRMDPKEIRVTDKMAEELVGEGRAEYVSKEGWKEAGRVQVKGSSKVGGR
jgi:hypothetical protein